MLPLAIAAAAIGSAAKKTLLTAPETPDAQKELFLGQEESKRKREELETSEEARQKGINEQRIKDREYHKQKLLERTDQVFLENNYNPTIPTEVEQINKYVENQNKQAAAIQNPQSQNPHGFPQSHMDFMETGIHSQEDINIMTGRMKEIEQKRRNDWLAAGSQHKSNYPAWD